MAQQPLLLQAQTVAGVSKVVEYIGKLISQNKTLAGLSVCGEVSDRSEWNGNLYFDLKEGKDILKCVAFSSVAAALPPFKNGDEIVCSGEFGTFRPQSRYTLRVAQIQLSGTGILFAQFQATKEKLRALGLFEADRKRPFPLFPQRIAVVSAPAGRGIDDFFTTMRERAPFVQLLTVETRVQGKGAEIDIADAIDRASRLDVDAIVVTRGGGSYEDLFPFNTEMVVRAIVRTRHPVLTAIGHTTDRHLADFAADKECTTPSNAAQWFGQIGDDWLRRVVSAQRTAQSSAMALVLHGSQRLKAAGKELQRSSHFATQQKERRVHAAVRRIDQASPEQRLRKRFGRLTEALSTVEAAGRYVTRRKLDRFQRVFEKMHSLRPFALRDKRQQAQLLSTRLVAANPKAPLERGYAIVTLGGSAIRNASQVPVGAQIAAQVQHGSLFARVERIEP